jgi:hypothetical protein
MERGFDDSKMQLVLSFNLPQSKTWRYSSPMRIIGAIKRGQIPIISEKFGDHPAEDLALPFPNDLDPARSLVTSLVFYRAQYIEDAWNKLQAYRKLSDENNREIFLRLRKIFNSHSKVEKSKESFMPLLLGTHDYSESPPVL